MVWAGVSNAPGPARDAAREATAPSALPFTRREAATRPTTLIGADGSPLLPRDGSFGVTRAGPCWRAHADAGLGVPAADDEPEVARGFALPLFALPPLAWGVESCASVEEKEAGASPLAPLLCAPLPAVVAAAAEATVAPWPLPLGWEL